MMDAEILNINIQIIRNELKQMMEDDVPFDAEPFAGASSYFPLNDQQNYEPAGAAAMQYSQFLQYPNGEFVPLHHLGQAIEIYRQQFCAISTEFPANMPNMRLVQPNILGQPSNGSNNLNSLPVLPPTSYTQNDLSKPSLLNVATTQAADEEQKKEERRQRDYNCDGFGTRRHTKYQQEQIDNKLKQLADENQEIDLSLIAMRADGLEKNPVMRIFRFFHCIHFYLNDTIPSRFNDAEYDEYEDKFSVRAYLPPTMNIQTQIKQLLYKCTIFKNNLQHMLKEVNENSNYLLGGDPKMHANGEISTQCLEQLLTQLGEFKNINFDHNLGYFRNSDSCVHADRLEHLLKQLSDNIRENKIYLHVANWEKQSLLKRYKEGNNLLGLQSYEKPVDGCVLNLESNTSTYENSKDFDKFKKFNNLKQYFDNDNEW